jgi:hypothetical protein
LIVAVGGDAVACLVVEGGRRSECLCDYERDFGQAIGGDICRMSHKFMSHTVRTPSKLYRRAAYWEGEFGFLRRAGCCWHISLKKHHQTFEFARTPD